MSLVVAIKDKGRIILGADKQVSFGEIKEHNAIKIWEVPELPGAIIGGVGTVRASQVIQYSQIINKNNLQELDTAFVVTNIVPAILNALESRGVKCTDSDTEIKLIPNVFIFAYLDRAWMIWQDLSVTEIENFIAIGSGAEIARGVLFATDKQNPFKRIVLSINAAAEQSIYVDDNVDLFTTESRKADAKQIASAFNLDFSMLEDSLSASEAVEISSEDDVKSANKKTSTRTKKSKME